MNSKYRGICCIVFSAFCFSLMSVFIRLAGDLPSMQKSLFRNLVAVFFAIGIMKKQKVGFSGDRKNLGLLVIRSLFGTMGILCNYYAVDHLVLADASMLNKMAPFFTLLFSFILLREKISLVQGLAVAGAFLGSLLILRPTGFDLTRLPAFVGLLGGMGAGIAYAFVRLLGTRGEKGPFIVFFFSSFSVLILLPFVIAGYHPMQWWQLGSLLLAGLAATGGQFGVTMAYCYAPAREISVYDYSQIIFSTIWVFLFFGQIPDAMSLAGYVIICAMGIWIFVYNKRKAQA